MAEPIKQKKTPVAKLDKILLVQPNDTNMVIATAPAPAPAPAPATAIAIATAPAPAPAPAIAPAPAPATAPAPAKTNQSGKGKGKVPTVPAGQSVITNLSQLNLDLQATDLPIPTHVEAVQLKKRGRKRKIALDPKYFNKDYITMWPEICMGQKVLVDRYDNVYSYDLETPRWLGVKTVFGKIDNTTETTPRTDYKYG